ncbi:MAG TPA: DNA polymerase III subunit delta [Actinomycetota bacterium]
MRPVTLILASDEFVASEALDRLRAEAAAEGLAGEEIDPGDPQALLYALDTQSLFGGGRLVLVRAAETLDADAQDAVEAWSKNPAEGVALVLMASGVAASKLAKRFPANAIVKAESVPPWKAAEWAVRRAKEKGRRLSGPAAAALVESVGSDLRDLAAAIDRLVETTKAATIEIDQVQERFTGVESKVYQFVDSVFDRDLPLARKRLHGLLDQGENPIGLLAALGRQLRVIAFVAGGDGRAPAAIAKDLGLKGEGPVKRAMRQARGFTPARIARAYRVMSDADLAMKSEEDDPLVLELLVDEIAAR